MPLSKNEIQRKIILIGERIVMLSKEKGLKQFELADKLNISEASLLRIEKGRINPTYRTLYLIADALEISVVSLVDLKD